MSTQPFNNKQNSKVNTIGLNALAKLIAFGKDAENKFTYAEKLIASGESYNNSYLEKNTLRNNTIIQTINLIKHSKNKILDKMKYNSFKIKTRYTFLRTKQHQN